MTETIIGSCYSCGIWWLIVRMPDGTIKRRRT
jgi:hypothetical protein